MGIETFVARRALANVGVAEMLRRSAASAPLRGLLPAAFVLLLPVAVLGVVAGGALATSIAPEEVGSHRVYRTGQGTAEMWAAGLSAALFLWGILWAPVLAACTARLTIRALHGERPGVGAVLRETFKSLPSALPLLLVGVFWVISHLLCFFPGLLAMAFVLPVGAVLAVESGSLGAAWSRAVALTKDQRFALAGALFVIDMVESAGSRFAAIFTPKSLTASYSNSDMWVYALLVTVVAAAFTVWRAALGVVAYHDLRTRAEGLEPDAIVLAIGGKVVVGLDISDQAVSSQQLGAMQKRRKSLVTAIVGGLTLALVAGLAYGPVSAWWKERKNKERFEADWARESQLRREREEERKAREAELGSSAPAASLPPGKPAAPPDEEVAVRIRMATSGRRKLVAEELGKRGAKLYGGGYGDVFKKLATAPEGLEWDTLHDRLLVAAKSEGCGDALEKAEAARTGKQAITFAASCPPGSEPRLLTAAQLTGVPLWAGVLATILELRAKDRGQDKNELHRAVIETLLAEKAAAE